VCFELPEVGELRIDGKLTGPDAVAEIVCGLERPSLLVGAPTVNH
jgi:hypothetical protein